MDLLPLSLCLLTLSGSTSAAGNGPEIIRVKEGEDVTLPCYISKNIRSERFEWKKDGQKDVFLYDTTELSGQDPQFTGRVSHSDAELMNGDASITIRETKVVDSGVYTCNFTNLNQTFSVKLVVGPVIITVEKGRDATLPCNINKDIRSERFDWKKDGQKEVYVYEGSKLSGQDGEFKDRVSHSDAELMNGDASITIREAKVADSGVYTCNFTNLHQTFSVYLVVGEAAKVYINKPEQTEDGTLLQCEVSDASPGFKLNICWFDGSGTKLTETQIDVKESGRSYILTTTVTKTDTYRCNATMEELSHQVYDKIYVYVSGPVIIRVKEGRDATLPCKINKDILSERIEWVKDGQKWVYRHEATELSGQDPQFRGRVSHSDAELMNGDASITIRETKVVDSGVYTCEFTNLHQTFTIYLVVGTCSKPSITSPEHTGDSVPLQCEVSDASPGFKLSISWFDGSGTKLTEKQIDTQSGRSYILTTTVTNSDTYRCVATMEELSHQVYSDTYVLVSGPLVWPWVVAAVAVIAAVVLFLYHIIKRRMNQPPSNDQESQPMKQVN